jgi:plastocyanin
MFMRICGAIAAALVVLATVLAAGAAAKPANTAVGVSEREYRISVYRKTVPPGMVRFNVTNFGEDAHDLTVKTKRGTVLAASDEIRSERTATLKVRLTKPGTYRLVCLRLDHAARGMRTTIVVKKPRKQ